jgi:hypothetical protein
MTLTQIGPRTCAASAYMHLGDRDWYVLWHDGEDHGVAGKQLTWGEMRHLLAIIRGEDLLVNEANRSTL